MTITNVVGIPLKIKENRLAFLSDLANQYNLPRIHIVKNYNGPFIVQ